MEVKGSKDKIDRYESLLILSKHSYLYFSLLNLGENYSFNFKHRKKNWKNKNLKEKMITLKACLRCKLWPWRQCSRYSTQQVFPKTLAGREPWLLPVRIQVHRWGQIGLSYLLSKHGDLPFMLWFLKRQFLIQRNHPKWIKLLCKETTLKFES